MATKTAEPAKARSFTRKFAARKFAVKSVLCCTGVRGLTCHGKTMGAAKK